MRFEKYQGLGNDFALVECDSEADVSPALVRALCDRHFGIGADGVLHLLPPTHADAHARLIVVNADGSRPEMCGNGLRCVALHLLRATAQERDVFVVETDAGPLPCRAERAPNQSAIVTNSLGIGTDLGPYELELDGARYRFRRISMGNPHAVTFQDELPTEALVDRVGAETCRQIAGGANVEFVAHQADRFDALVFERGVGRTLACGTGAAAVAVAAVLAGQAAFDRRLEVHLPGGSLGLTVAKSLEVTLTGPARWVYSGQMHDRP